MSEPDLEAGGPLTAIFMNARWKLERVSDERIDLLIWQEVPAPDLPGALRFPMGAAEAFAFVGAADRVLSYAAGQAEGTFSNLVASPEDVRKQISVHGYIVTSKGMEAHTRLVQATPWASWVEEVPAPDAGQVAWFVNVFAADNHQFVEAARVHDASFVPAAYVPGDADGRPGRAGD